MPGQFPLRTLLVDDEPLAINRLRRLLKPYEDTFEIVGEAANGLEGLKAVDLLKPDLVFLDIEMPGLNGFEMLARLPYLPIVVFATAYDDYAVRAFEENSIDYLLKPIESERLEKTVERIRKMRLDSAVASPDLRHVFELLKPKKELHSISVKTGDRILLIPLSNIAYFEAEDKYVFLNTLDGQQFLTSHTITTLEEKLPDTFTRISRSTLLNIRHIREIQRHFNGKFVVVMQDKKATQLMTGSSFTDNLKNLMEL
ncbi:LytTR family two component transcriptional regulator [Larkinella arboricola]|uniref:LytTR family two component transcriptional regulator n=1 Tax=Larkinella arboricola TaxID=643671 RepID=A0A327XA45_LARAB|nr:LytTR family transcriptional regulator DNA-binding domain-containing protein [Larkinella arboricola]RAK02492.1 LytTR family two component transcriptional regulator [Larkinella arboricola]